MLFKGGGQSK